MMTADGLRKMQTAQRGTFVERIACCDLDGIEAKMVLGWVRQGKHTVVAVYRDGHTPAPCEIKATGASL